MRKISLSLISFFILSISVHAGDDKPASAYIQQLAIDPAHSGTIYAASTSAGLYKSTDHAATWRTISPDTTSRFCVVRIAPDNSSRIYAGGENTGLWISNDAGETWDSVQLPGTTICEMAITPSNPDKIFVLSKNGVYRTKNIQHNQWEMVFDYIQFQKNELRRLNQNLLKTYSNLSHRYSRRRHWSYSRFQKIAVSPHNPDFILLGARWEGGYFRSDDGGDTWQNHWISGMFRRVDPIIFHPDDPAIIYVGTHHQGWFKSFNGGKSWISLSRGLAPQIRTPYYGAFLISGAVMNPQNPVEFYTGSDYSNWKTSDDGLTWQELGPTLTCEFSRSFAVDPVRSEIIYAGTNVGVFKSEDAGKTWKPANNGFPTLEIRQSLDADILGIRYRYALTENGPQIFRKRLTPPGEWQSMNWLLTTTVDSIAFDPVTQRLILKTEYGKITSDDGGFRWSSPEIQNQPGPISAEAAPFNGDPSDENFWTIHVSIQGEPFFADSLVDAYYQRPPYVSIQLVTQKYPVDGSEPVRAFNFERYLRGTIQIPKSAVKAGESYMLYVEARDFQWNVRTGHAFVNANETSRINIPVSTSHLLPALRR